MERLVLALLKLVLKLTWILFKFALRVVLFAWSGDWKKLDKIEAELREVLAKAKNPQPVQRQHRSPKAKAPSKRAPATGQGPWPFEFAPELTEDEGPGEIGGSEITGGESVSQPTKARPRARRRLPPPPPKELPLALALRQPSTVRDAMVLTAVLGPRGRRDRRF